MTKCLIVLLASLTVAAFAQTGGYVCNYTPIGDESTQDAVPIQDFRTSGLDFVRPSWCVTHCADRKSVKVAARFDLANATSDTATYKLFHSFTRESGLKLQRRELISGTPTRRDGDDDFDFCIDADVSTKVDMIINQYNTIEDMSEALNYYINKPNWAYLIYDMGVPPSIIGTDNVKQDVNYCNKFVNKQLPDGTYALYQVFSGKIKDN